jgi:hypothetical protein
MAFWDMMVGSLVHIIGAEFFKLEDAGSRFL